MKTLPWPRPGKIIGIIGGIGLPIEMSMPYGPIVPAYAREHRGGASGASGFVPELFTLKGAHPALSADRARRHWASRAGRGCCKHPPTLTPSMETTHERGYRNRYHIRR